MTVAEQWVYVVNIDIKDGWYDCIHAFTSRAAAEAYLAWEADHVGDHAYISAVPLMDAWTPPPEMQSGGVW